MRFFLNLRCTVLTWIVHSCMASCLGKCMEKAGIFFSERVYQQCLKHCSFAWKKLCTFPSDVENTPVWRCESTKSAKFGAIFLKLLPVQFCLIMIAKRCKSRTQISAYDQFQVVQDNGDLWGTTAIIWRSTYKYPKDELWERPFNISGFMQKKYEN